MSKEEKSKNGKKSGIKNFQNKKGVHGRTAEQMTGDGIKGGNKAYEDKIGIHALTSKEKSEAGQKGGKSVSSQKWRCLETGFITNPGNLSRYQKARGIDKSLRERVS